MLFGDVGSTICRTCHSETRDPGLLNVGPVPELRSVPVPVVEEFQSTVVAGGPLVAPLVVPAVAVPGLTCLRRRGLVRSSRRPVTVSALFQFLSARRSTSVDVLQPRTGKFQLPVIRGGCRRLAGPCSCRLVPGGRRRGHTSSDSRRRVDGSLCRVVSAVGLTFGLKDIDHVAAVPDRRAPGLPLVSRHVPVIRELPIQSFTELLASHSLF